MEISTGNLLLTALDHRAAAYEKLDKLQAALRDSKQMIDLKPELAKVMLSESYHYPDVNNCRVTSDAQRFYN